MSWADHSPSTAWPTFDACTRPDRERSWIAGGHFECAHRFPGLLGLRLSQKHVMGGWLKRCVLASSRQKEKGRLVPKCSPNPDTSCGTCVIFTYLHPALHRVWFRSDPWRARPRIFRAFESLLDPPCRQAVLSAGRLRTLKGRVLVE